MTAEKLSVETLKEALETYDWQKTKVLLDAAGGPTVNHDNIAEALRRTGNLVLEYPSTLEKKRNTILQELRSYLAAGQTDSNVPATVVEALSTIQVAEAGYRKLVDDLSKTSASKLDPTVHVSAAIRRAEDELVQMSAEFEKQISQRHQITLHSSILDDFGYPVDMDAFSESVIGFVSMTLQMEAFRQKWFDREGAIIVPSLPDVTEESVSQVGATFALAAMWRRWRMTEERARMLGRTLRFLNANERPADASPQLTTFIADEGQDSSDLLHRIALERVTDKMSQNMLELRAFTQKNRPRIKFPGGVRALPPLDWISNAEVHGLWGLEQYLAYDVISDQERPGGLRLVEWVRGFSALMLLARDVRASDLTRTRSGWQDYLARFGLPAAASEILISRLTFGRSSRDLFDHPFIKLGNGRYRLFAPALRSLSIPIVVLSVLSHLSVQLKRKGASFEATVRETFEMAGIKAYAFKAKRGTEEYEYDALVPWGNYLFVIECKNRSLPFGNPIQMRYFDLQTQESINQVHRLMKGLDEHPDILANNLPPEAATMVRVPVIVNCFPYSVSGRLSDVYLYDYSALSRFFENGEIKIKAVSPSKQVNEYDSGIRLWKGENPTPEDLLAQMDEPTQVKTVEDSLERDPRGYQLSLDWWVYDVSFMRHETESVQACRARPLADPPTKA